MKIEDRPKVGTGPDWLRSREGCAWDRSSQLRCLPLAILPQARRQNPASSKSGGKQPTNTYGWMRRQFELMVKIEQATCNRCLQVMNEQTLA